MISGTNGWFKIGFDYSTPTAIPRKVRSTCSQIHEYVLPKRMKDAVPVAVANTLGTHGFHVQMVVKSMLVHPVKYVIKCNNGLQPETLPQKGCVSKLGILPKSWPSIQ